MMVTPGNLPFTWRNRTNAWFILFCLHGKLQKIWAFTYKAVHSPLILITSANLLQFLADHSPKRITFLIICCVCMQSCAPAAPTCPWRLTFTPRELKNLRHCSHKCIFNLFEIHTFCPSLHNNTLNAIENSSI